MAVLLLLLLLASAMPPYSSGTWCICKGGISDAVLQKTLDYACGSGADCNPTRPTGPCFNPNTVRAHCNYAVNSYFQKNRQAPTACDFSGTASLVTSDPSSGGCAYPATASGSTSTTTPPVTTTPTTPATGTPTTPATGTPTTTTATPYGGSSSLGTTPSTGILGGANNGMSPSAINNDFSVGMIHVPKDTLFYLSSMLIVFTFFWA